MVFAFQPMEDAGVELAFEPVVVRDVFGTDAAAEAALVTGTSESVEALGLTTIALEALDAVEAEAADTPAADEFAPAQQDAELPEVAVAPMSEDAPADPTGILPPVAEDAASVDEFVFDDDLQAIFALYDNFVPPASEDGPIVIAPLPRCGGAFLQVITQGPDGQWYSDSSLTKPVDGEPIQPTIEFCPVIGWEGLRYLPEPGADVLLG